MDLKSELAKAVRVLSRGEVLTQLFGHISVRLEETPDEFYILGHVHSEGNCSQTQPMIL